MKKLTRLLLIHWYTYDRELIEFENINFLTGKTAAGKSTIIDALQLVLLGDTNGNFFNKAANERSVRTLKSYLYGENGDDGETGFRYLRAATFTSYVVVEFEDTEKQTRFLLGLAADCYEDLHFDYKWFTVDKMGIPENCFTNPRTNTPYTIPQLKRYLRDSRKRFEIIDTNRRYQEIIMGKYGAVKRKYLVLLKKAVPFTPITDIEKFITESICDVRNNIQIEQMQSDIRQYKNLEADAARTHEKVIALREIETLTEEYEADRERYRLQSYIILRALREEAEQEAARIRDGIREQRDILEEAEARYQNAEKEISRLRREIEEMESEYHGSDIAQKQKRLEEEIRSVKTQIGELEDGLRCAAERIGSFGAHWLASMDSIEQTQFPADTEKRELAGRMAALGAQRTALASAAEELSAFDIKGAAREMAALREELAGHAFELKLRARQIAGRIEELSGRIQNLKKGIKPYPSRVTALKSRLEAELFKRHGKAVEIPIFAELLEIRNPAWQDAIEGYLDKQKFYLLVPDQHFTEANKIYNRIKKEEKIFDAGLVDLGRLRREYRGKPTVNSLAEEIETDNRDARLYADYLLGNVMKCEDPGDFATCRTGITKEVMLYKNYVSRRLNPARYADPFIGRRSLEIQLQNLTRQLEEEKRELQSTQNEHRLIDRAAKENEMSEFEAEQLGKAVEEAHRIPALEERLDEVQSEYEGLDLTWLFRLGEKIDEKKEEREAREKERSSALETRAGAKVRLEQLEKTDLAAAEEKIKQVKGEIAGQFAQNWIEETAEPRFLKELHADGRSRLTLRESFTRARNQTATIMEGHLRERRKKCSDYNQEYRMPYDTEREDNDEYSGELRVLSDIRLPEYLSRIVDAKEKAYNQFRDDFIAKLKSNIESVRAQIEELNYSLRNSVFGTDRYRFTIGPRAEYRNYYDMIMDPLLMDTGGWNIASQSFNEKYQKEIDSLFRTLIFNETNVTAERRAEYEKSVKKFTDYKTYLVFDLIVTNEQGEEQRLSKTLLKKSGGETQIPFYIALLASFSQVCRIRSKGKNNTIRLIILDEAFSKMDGERIRESIGLLKRFGLQAIFSAPPEKIPDIAPIVDRNIAVYKSGHHSFTRSFDPAQIEEEFQ